MTRNIISIVLCILFVKTYAQSSWAYINSEIDIKELKGEDNQLKGLVLNSFIDFKILYDSFNCEKIETLIINSKLSLSTTNFLVNFPNLKRLILNCPVDSFNLSYLPFNISHLKLGHKPKYILNINSKINLKSLIISKNINSDDILKFLNNEKIDTLIFFNYNFNKLKNFKLYQEVNHLFFFRSKGIEINCIKEYFPNSNLKSLNFFACKINHKIVFKNNFDSLKKISIVHCGLRNVENIENLQKINYLDLSNNNLDRVLINLPKLNYLDLSNNVIHTISLLNLSDSVHLDISYNKVNKIEGLCDFSAAFYSFYFGYNPKFNTLCEKTFINLIAFSYSPKVYNISIDPKKILFYYDLSDDIIYSPKQFNNVLKLSKLDYNHRELGYIGDNPKKVHINFY